MNRKIQLISAISLLSLGIGSAWAAVSVKVKCEDMGYTTPRDDCLEAGGTPLFCPFFDAKDNPMTLCVKSSCRGYPLKAEDLDGKAADGKSIRDHVESVDECSVSPLEDSEKFYKVVKCKETSLFQNGLCDVGCLAARYPYDSHQGNIAGDMRKCEDNIGTGEHYGYETCNDGWEGGWQKTKDTANPTGKCLLSNCSIKNYPYASDPNIIDNRGATTICRVGGNIYYRYTQTDNNGVELTDNACGISNSYHLGGAVCYKECYFDDCSYTIKNETLSGYDFSYKEWSCSLQTENCRVGDEAVINGINVGIITHLPDEDTDKVNIISESTVKGTYASGEWALDNVPLPDLSGANMIKDKNGKYNTAFILAYKAKRNETASSPYSFPIFEKVSQFSPADCSEICGAGEWYFYAGRELYQIFENRYVIYNRTQDTAGTRFISSNLGSSTNFGGQYVTMMAFSGSTSTGSLYGDLNKATSSLIAHPMISFTLKE